MIWLSFGQWSRSTGRHFVKERIYLSGHRWTPFVRVYYRRMPWEWEIVIPNGIGVNTSIMHNGRQIDGITSAQLSIHKTRFAELTLTIHPRKLRVMADGIELSYVVPLPDMMED
jgi:hypothetical protein